MRISKIFTPRSIVLILIISFALGIISSVLISCTERIFFSREYNEHVEKYSSKYGVPKELVYAVIKAESNFESDAVSRVGAVGLMQLMPSTYEWLAQYHFNEDIKADALYDPETNIKFGVYYLQYLFSKFGSWEKAVIAYNWGEGNFANFLDSNEYEKGNYKSIPVKETRNYVSKVMRYWEKYNNLYK